MERAPRWAHKVSSPLDPSLWPVSLGRGLRAFCWEPTVFAGPKPGIWWCMREEGKEDQTPSGVGANDPKFMWEVGRCPVWP